MLMVDIDVSLEADNIPREQVELARRFWRRAKGEQEPGSRLARRLRCELGGRHTGLPIEMTLNIETEQSQICLTCIFDDYLRFPVLSAYLPRTINMKTS